jgi:hypothetical protein
MKRWAYVMGCCMVSSLVHAGVYSQDFNAAANNSTDLGDGSIISGSQAFVYNPSGTDGFLVLSQDFTGGVIGNFVLPVLDPVDAITGFTATFDSYFKASGVPADGFSFNVGSIGSLPYGGEEGMYSSGSMLSIGFDTYSNQGIRVFTNGVLAAENTSIVPIVDSSWKGVEIVLDANGLDVTYDGSAVFTDLNVSGYNPQTGDRFGFAARTGAAYEDAFFDNVNVQTVPEPATLGLVGLFGCGAMLVRRIFKI